jgi:formylglycine-generating enzyme required for sulfatase activity
MVKIPGGRLWLGLDDGPRMQRPRHEVSVAPFELDVTEVTVAEYAECVAAGRCQVQDIEFNPNRPKDRYSAEP